MPSNEQVEYGKSVLKEIRARMAGNSRLTPFDNSSGKYQQYKPQNGNESVWDKGKCHFEFEINGERTKVEIAFHCEPDCPFREKMGILIKKNFGNYELSKRNSVPNCCIVYKTIDFSNKNIQQIAEEAVSAMNKFASEENINTINQIIKESEGFASVNEVSQMPDAKESINTYVNLLLNNHNIILHGAPGTGKTYLAKEIAKKLIFPQKTEEELKKDLSPIEQQQFNGQCGFVQFHQSYDYTDFVEGLRPVNKVGSSDIGFQRKDGIFKKFCKKALDNLIESGKTSEELGAINFWKKKCNDYFASIEGFDDVSDDESSSDSKNPNSFETKGTKNKFQIDSVDDDLVTISVPNNSKKNVVEFNISELVSVLANGKFQKVKDVRDALKRSRHRQKDSYLFVLAEKIYGKVGDEKDKIEKVSEIEKKKFIFIIDEINRGEMSKIFGELFYSIDPGYRVQRADFEDANKKNNLVSIQTQYSNMLAEPNAFDNALGITESEENKDNYGHFFVPENVYIIGTMNDIDRSVESMDFAMRRRFAFKEVTAEQSQAMFDNGTKWKNGKGEEIDVSSQLDEIKQRMNNLNNAILNKDFNLNSSYQIGGAYFLKFANYCKVNNKNEADGDQTDAFNSLWTNHLEGVLREYLRGMDDSKKLLGKLENAYNLTASDKKDGTFEVPNANVENSGEQGQPN